MSEKPLEDVRRADRRVQQSGQPADVGAPERAVEYVEYVVSGRHSVDTRQGLGRSTNGIRGRARESRRRASRRSGPAVYEDFTGAAPTGAVLIDGAGSTGSCPVSELTGAVLLSDGAGRLVGRFQLTGRPGVMTLLAAADDATIAYRTALGLAQTASAARVVTVSASASHDCRASGVRSCGARSSSRNSATSLSAQRRR